MASTAKPRQVRELCADIFAEIWGVDKNDLLCSFDGGCFLNTKVKSRRDDTLDFNVKDLWVHVDTPRSGDECYQGVVNFADCGEKEGGLVLVENSQEIFNGYMDSHCSAGYSWMRAHTSDPLFDDARYLKVCAPEGHLIIWNGKMFHCNCPPTDPDPSTYRMCLYVSMQPREFATQKELEKRIKLYEEGRMTGHWCYGPYFSANAKNPRTYGKEVVTPGEIEIAELNDLRSRLIGY